MTQIDRRIERTGGVHGGKGGMISQIGRVVERSRGSQSISVQPLFSTPRTLRGRDRPVDSY